MLLKKAICLKIFGIKNFANDARNETNFAATSFSSEARNIVTAIARQFGGSVKAGRNDKLGARGFMELELEGLEQKFCNATTSLMRHNCAQLRALLTTWRNCEVQEELIGSWYLKSRKVKKLMRQANRVHSHSWERSCKNGCK